MAAVIRMPEVLANVTEAAIQTWLVAPGDTISPDTPIAEIETEKAMVEFAAEQSGVIVELFAKTGVTIDVGEPIALLREAGDSDADVDAARPAGTAVDTAAGDITAEVEPQGSATSVRAGQDESAQETPGTISAERMFASPIVRRMAKELGLDITGIVGTGPGGRIVRRDLEALPLTEPAALSAPVASVPAAEPAAQSVTGHGEVIPLSGMRKAIARRLTESKSTVPHFYLTANCRVDALFALRKQVNETSSRKISVNDFVVKATAQALADVPEANAIWGGDHIRRFDQVDIAVAVSTDGGLLTPVVRDIGSLSLTSLSESIADLAERARAGRLKQDELEGGSFSISNLGMYGVEEFSAILNPPQSGILAVGAAAPQPVVVDGNIEVGTVMTVTLSADHRVVDGALAAQWLQAFKNRLENPLSILI